VSPASCALRATPLGDPRAPRSFSDGGQQRNGLPDDEAHPFASLHSEHRTT
jgi:hypothetical protein